jgi:type I restriction enzyme S subunit
MSKIDKLIDELCPKVMEFKELRELTVWDKRFNGVSKEKQTKVLSFRHVSAKKLKDLETPNGCVKLLSTGQFNGWTNEDLARENLNNGEVIAIPSGGSANLKYYKGMFVDSGNILASSFNHKILNLKYCYYYLLVKNDYIENCFRGSGVKHPDMAKILSIKIPLPPIVIQEKIVEILDSFTELKAELEKELKKELEDRKKQYKHYRDEMFNIKDVEHKTLGELGTFFRGKRFVKSDIVAKGVPCIHYGEMYTHYNIWARESKSFLEPSLAKKLRVAHPGDVIIVAAGETIEDIGRGVAWLGDSDIVTHDACFTFVHNLDPKYVSYFLQTKNFHSQIEQYISSGKISSINASGLKKAIIPVPPIKIQQEIVKNLDKLDLLMNDISLGLAAEVSARRSQYEYYREKLLTFNKYVD